MRLFTVGEKMELEESIRNICLADAYIEGENIYAAGFEQNMLFKYNLKSLKIEWMDVFKEYELPTSFQIRDVYKYEDSLFFFSKNSYEIAEYNLKKNCLLYFYPPNNIEENNLIQSLCQVEDEIWMFQNMKSRSITIFSMKKRKYVQEKIEIKGEIVSYFPISFESSIYIDSKIWCCIPGSSDLLIIDRKEFKAEVLKTNLNVPFFRMSYNEGILYILTMNGKDFICLNVSSYEIVKYQTGYIGEIEFPFFEILIVGNVILFLPCFENKILCHNLNESASVLPMIKQLEFPKEFKKIHDIKHRTLFRGWRIQGNILYLFPFAGNGMLSLDLEILDIKYHPIKISKEEYLWWKAHVYPIQYESNVSLNEYLEGTKYDSKFRNQEENLLEEQKENIWEIIS